MVIHQCVEDAVDLEQVYSTTDACQLAQTTREAVRHLQRTEVWFAKTARQHSRWSVTDVATLAILSHLVQDLGMRANAVSGFAESIWRICSEVELPELMAKRLYLSMIDFEVELVAATAAPTMPSDGVVVPRLPIALGALKRHLRSREGGNAENAINPGP